MACPSSWAALTGDTRRLDCGACVHMGGVAPGELLSPGVGRLRAARSLGLYVHVLQ